MTTGDQFPIDQSTAGRDLAIAERRELARAAVDAIADVVGRDISVPELVALADNKEERHTTRLMARRGLRFVAALGQEGSELARRLDGKDEVYAAAESFITFGASTGRYTAMLCQGLSPQEATGLYALREVMSEHFNNTESFSAIIAALAHVGVEPSAVHHDVDTVFTQLYEAGLFQSTRGTILTRSYLFVGSSAVRPAVLIEGDQNGAMTADLIGELRLLGFLPPEEVDGDSITPEDRNYWR